MDPNVTRTKRCPDPGRAVGHKLFGTAVKCARPDCNELLYRLEDGRRTLNCRIAHIRASSPKGPRADPTMTCAMVNAFDNLLLLCLFHAAQIDDDETWQDYPVELLTEWKSQQVLHADLLGSAPTPTDAEVDELLVMSRERDPITRSVTIDLARAVRRLRSAASEPGSNLLASCASASTRSIN